MTCYASYHKILARVFISVGVLTFYELTDLFFGITFYILMTVSSLDKSTASVAFCRGTRVRVWRKFHSRWLCEIYTCVRLWRDNVYRNLGHKGLIGDTPRARRIYHVPPRGDAFSSVNPLRTPHGGGQVLHNDGANWVRSFSIGSNSRIDFDSYALVFQNGEIGYASISAGKT